MLQFNKKHFFAGLFGTWLVGMGRYWDDPKASLLQHLGLGSVIYIFCLSFFIWLIVFPLLVEKWKYFTVLTFISLTSFPAALYAIPVERFMSVNHAGTVNLWFLLIVALWRLLLLIFFLSRYTRLGPGYITVVALLPVCLIIVTLTALNLERAVFDLMGDISDGTSHDAAYAVLVGLTILSAILAVPLLLGYIACIVKRRHQRSIDLFHDE